jgi:hypothetical protein
MEGWEKKCQSGLGDPDWILMIYVLEKRETKWLIASELVELWAEIKTGKRSLRQYIAWAGKALYLDEIAEVGEPRNKVREFTYALGKENKP